MNNTHIYDDDLNPILEKASNEDLEIIHDIIIKKMSQELTDQDVYKQYHPDHKQYADLIAKEVRAFGGNTFANIVRGEGPAYHEIVCDVAKKIKASFNEAHDIASIEMSILSTILEKAFEKMTEEEKREVLVLVEKSNKSWTGPASAMAFQAIFRAGGFQSYQLMVTVVNALLKELIGRGLPLAANAVLNRAMAVAVGPIGWAITGIITLIQIAGPSYKVTIPIVAYVAMLRARQNAVICGKCKTMVDESFTFCSECGAPL